MICNVINDHTTVCASVECVAQTLKPFLTRSVPDLKWNDFTTFDLNLFLYKICTNCSFMAQTWLLILVWFYDATFANTWVPNNYNLKKLLLFTRSGWWTLQYISIKSFPACAKYSSSFLVSILVFSIVFLAMMSLHIKVG